MLNNLTIVGRLTADPVKRELDNGLVLVNFTLAINGKKDQEKGTDYVEYIDCSVNEFLHNSVINNLQKGDKVAVSGKFSNRPYTDKTGLKRTSPVVYVDNIEFIDVLKFQGKDEPAEEVQEPVKEEPKPKTTTRRR